MLSGAAVPFGILDLRDAHLRFGRSLPSDPVVAGTATSATGNLIQAVMAGTATFLVTAATLHCAPAIPRLERPRRHHNPPMRRSDKLWRFPGSGPNDVMIQVGSKRFARPADGQHQPFRASRCRTTGRTDREHRVPARRSARGNAAGAAVPIYIGSDLIITGKIDRRSIPLDARNHLVTLSGPRHHPQPGRLFGRSAERSGDSWRPDQWYERPRRGDQCVQGIRHHRRFRRSPISASRYPCFRCRWADALTRSSRAWRATPVIWSTRTCSANSCWTASAPRSMPPAFPFRAMSRRFNGERSVDGRFSAYVVV